jgi:hypothetical protein
MSVTIDKLKVKTFEGNVRHLAQQTETALWPWVQHKNKNSSSHSFPRMGKHTLVAKSGPRTATPIEDSVWSNRVATPATKHQSDTVEPEDAPQMIVDPKSNISLSLGYAAKRAYDSMIIAAATGNAPDEAGNANAFPAGNIVGDGTTEFAFKYATEINKMFQSADVPPEMGRVAVIGPNQAQLMLHMTQATSGDYVFVKQLADGGYVRNFMGFTWIVSNLLTAPETGQLDCLFFTHAALGMLETKEIWTRMAEDPTLSFLTRIYIALTAGAVRVEDEHIYVFRALDSATIA